MVRSVVSSLLLLLACTAVAAAQPLVQTYTTQATAPRGQSAFEAGHQPVATARGRVAQEQVIASVPVDGLSRSEILQLAFDGEYTANHDEFGYFNARRFSLTLRHRVVFANGPSETGGEAVGPPLRDTVTPEQHHAQWGRVLTHEIAADRPGRTWVNVVARLDVQTGPNGNDGFAGFRSGSVVWSNTWVLGTLEPRYATVAVQRWSDHATTEGRAFVALGRSATPGRMPLPMTNSPQVVRTSEVDLGPGDVVMLSAETDVETDVVRPTAVRVSDEIRVEPPESAGGALTGTRVAALAFDGLPPADRQGASGQRFHGVVTRGFYRVPPSGLAGRYRFHHVLRAAGSPAARATAGEGEIAAVALRGTPQAGRARRAPSQGTPAVRLERRVLMAAEQQPLAGAGELAWPATVDRSSAATLRFTGSAQFCKQQPVPDYGPSTRPDARGAPRVRFASDLATVAPAHGASRPELDVAIPFAVGAGGAIRVGLDNPFVNVVPNVRASLYGPPPAYNTRCTRGAVPRAIELWSAAQPPVTALDDSTDGATLETATDTPFRELSRDPAAPTALHTVRIAALAAGDTVLLSYRGVIDDDADGTGPVTAAVAAQGERAGTVTALRPTAENATVAARSTGVRRQGVWIVPESFGDDPQTVTFTLAMSAQTPAATRLAPTSGDQAYSGLQVLALRAAAATPQARADASTTNATTVTTSNAAE